MLDQDDLAGSNKTRTSERMNSESDASMNLKQGIRFWNQLVYC